MKGSTDMSMDLSKAATAPAWLAKKRAATCLLCDRATEIIGVWVPGPSSPYGHPRGGQRYVVYSLCEDCARHADERIDLIERAIVAQLAQVGMGPMN
jgi:hypothetical protein